MPRARCLPTITSGGRSDTLTKGPLSPRAEDLVQGAPNTCLVASRAACLQAPKKQGHD